MDLITYSIVTGRRFRALVIVNNCSWECPVIEMDTSLGGRRLVDLLEKLSEFSSLPEAISIDNGPEFASKILDERAYRRGVKLNFIRLGKTIENAYAGSFISRVRDEYLNENWFISLTMLEKLSKIGGLTIMRAGFMLRSDV